MLEWIASLIPALPLISLMATLALVIARIAGSLPEPSLGSAVIAV